jgi:hypothetical protein
MSSRTLASSGISELVHSAWLGPRCPSLIYCIWRSGRHALMNLTCKSWRCINCGRIKRDEMTQQLADATVDTDLLFEVVTDKKNADTIMKYLRSRKIPSLNVKFTDCVYIVCDKEAGGRNWQMEPIIKLEAIIRVNSFDLTKIMRRDFTSSWKPESLYEPKRDTVILSRRFDSLNDARRELNSFGQDVDKELINGDPLDLMERMLKADGEFKLILGGG